MQIQFAIDDAARGDSIVESLLAAHLIACGQRTGPMTSRYWWGGSVEQAEEWLVILKTRSELASRVIDAVVSKHPYEVPEVVAVPILDGSRAYLAWIDKVTSAALR
ncbi:MAG TPA: divalent-cation tolerance protein CutA [Acidimicrobiales bacterium]|nr:divalent-cation tolerance protein CutA [Acidimicrobiales bacterium]